MDYTAFFDSLVDGQVVFFRNINNGRTARLTWYEPTRQLEGMSGTLYDVEWVLKHGNRPLIGKNK